MSLNADTLLDRIYLKGQITKWRILAIVAFVLVVLVAAERFWEYTPIESSYIARVTVDEIILDSPERAKLLERLRTNDNVKAVLVVLDTPGGSAVAGQELYLALRKIAANKPVVALMKSMATSAGYMAALGTDHIFAREGTITGSIGVIIQTAEVTELADKIGIKPITIKSAPLKGTPSPFEKVDAAQREAIQSLVDDFFRYFVEMVVERRHLTRDQALALADGRVYSGTAALRLKLIDALGGEAEAKAWLHETRKIDDSLEIKDVKIKKNMDSFSDILSNMAGHTPLAEMLVKLDGLVSIWQPAGI